MWKKYILKVKNNFLELGKIEKFNIDEAVIDQSDLVKNIVEFNNNKNNRR